MSAADNLNHQQLKMFMSPNEMLESGVQFGDTKTGYGETPTSMLERKVAEAKGDIPYFQGGPDLYNRLATEGVQKPLHMRFKSTTAMDPTLVDGHHRFAVTQDVDPDRLMPVEHSGFSQLGRGRFAETPLQARAARKFGRRKKGPFE